MSTLTHAGTQSSTSNASSYTTAGITPAANDWLIVFVLAAETTAAGSLTDSQGLGFTKVASVSAGGNMLYCFTANALAAASSTTFTFDCTGDAATGATISIVRVAGGRWLRQAKTASGLASTTPTVAMNSAVGTSRAVIGVCANLSNPARLTPRSSRAYTEYTDTGFATPTTGFEGMAIASGETGTSIAWGGTSATDWMAIVVEIYNDGEAVTGSLAATESGSDTFAADADVKVSATLASTEAGADLFAADADVAVTGTLAAAETGSDGFAVDSDVEIAGSLAATETGSDTLAATAAAKVTGSLSAAESGSDAFSADADVGITGSLSATESGSDAFAADADVKVTATVSATESGSDTFAATGNTTGGITGTFAASEEGGDTFAAEADVKVSGALSATETGSDAFTADADVKVAGALAATETGPDAFAAGADVKVAGTLAATESGDDAFAANGLTNLIFVANNPNKLKSTPRSIAWRPADRPVAWGAAARGIRWQPEQRP